MKNARLLDFRLQNNWSQEDLALKLGISQAMVMAIENGAAPSMDVIKRINSLLGDTEDTQADIDLLINLRLKNNWSQRQLADELGVSKSLISAIEQGSRSLSYKLKHQILNMINSTDCEGVINSNTSAPQEITPVPFYSAKASAGYGKDLPEYEEKEVIYFDKRWLRNIIGVEPSNASLVQAEGDSMDSGNGLTSDIKDGDLLLVDNSITYPINNQKFVVRLEDSKLVVKKIKVELDGSVMLISNNPKYEPFKVPKADIIGKVMWNGSITV